MPEAKSVLIACIGIAVIFVAAGCGGDSGSTAKLETPTVYESDLIAEYSALGGKGYAALDAGNPDSAIAYFEQQVALIPEGKWGHYNLACAAGRTGDVQAGMKHLQAAVAGGWDDPSHLESDPDLAALRDDDRFAELLAEVRTTRAEKESLLAAGLPEIEEPKVTFTTEEELNEWLTAQQQVLRANSRVWHGWQAAAAELDLQATRLAIMRAIKGDEFDYKLERIIAMAQMNSPYAEQWGPICGTIISEVDAYLQTDPDPEAKDEACYRGITAAVMEHGMEAMAGPEGDAALAKAEAYHKQMRESSMYYGPGEVWIVAARINQAGDNREALYPVLAELQKKYADDENASQIARALIPADLVKASWPIPIDAVDIDGNKVSLADYRGEVVLVEFWATWCGPCRGELPYLKDVYAKYKSDGFEILSISLDYPNRVDQAQYRQWIDEAGMEWRHVYDEQNWNSPITTAYFVGSIPSPFLIGRDGSLIAMHEECRGEDLEKVVREALDMEPL